MFTERTFKSIILLLLSDDNNNLFSDLFKNRITETAQTNEEYQKRKKKFAFTGKGTSIQKIGVGVFPEHFKFKRFLKAKCS